MIKIKGRKGEKMREEESRERSSTFSLNFSCDRTGGTWQSKKKSVSPLKGFQVETGIEEF